MAAPLRQLELPPLPAIEGTHQHSADTRWLEMSTVTYRPEHHAKPLTYEMVNRKQKGYRGDKERHGKLDAVDVVALTRSKQRPEWNNHIMLVVQYRPPINAFTIEFPSGCVDEDDATLQNAALRELLEETGYMGEVKEVFSKTAYEASITSSCGVAIHVEVDFDRPANQKPTQTLDDDEWSLKVVMTPLASLYDDLIAFAKSRSGVVIDSRLSAFALGAKMCSRG